MRTQRFENPRRELNMASNNPSIGAAIEAEMAEVDRPY